MVIAVDAPWGAGKSILLKCWVGAHQNENNGAAKTVYFDAFRNDYMDDPLIGLVSEISHRFEPQGKPTGQWKAVKEAASKLGRPAARIGLAVVTAGVTEIAAPVVDAALKAGSKELEKASQEFWQKEDGRKAAMDSFRRALEGLASEEKLVVVVDELDRCRPDYALNLLEVIKHFFDVPNVHFVLGVNLRELANSVRVRYGASAESQKYLQKFVTLVLPLSGRNPRASSLQAASIHFENVARQIGLIASWKAEWIKAYLEFIDWDAGLSLRDVERIATLAMVTPEPSGSNDAHLHLYIGAMIISVTSPSFFDSLKNKTLTESDVTKVFNFDSIENSRSYTSGASKIWRLIGKHENATFSHGEDEALAEYFNDENPREQLRKIIADCLGTFELMG